MGRRYGGWLVVVLVLAVVGRAKADEPDAAALVRSVREGEAWIDRVKSLWLKADVAWERTPEGIAKQRKQLQAQFPGQDVEGRHELQARSFQQVELAFDGARYRTWDRSRGRVDYLKVWDGSRFISDTAVKQEAGRPDRHRYFIAPDAIERINALLNFGGFRTAHHPFWWLSRQTNEEVAPLYAKPEEFAYVGKADFDGAECHVVCRWGTWARYYVSVADGRLRGLKDGAQSHTVPSMTDRLLKFFKEAGQDFADEAELARWFQSRTPEETKAVDRKLSARLLTLTEPIFEHGLADYKEVAPGCWLPMTQTSVTRFIDEKGRNVVDHKATLTITEAHVDEPLPDSLFQVEFHEGGEVVDETHKPRLVYRHKTKFTPEEWAAIVAEGQKDASRDEAHEQAQRALVGRPAPEFPAGARWLNGDPLKWSDLAGKRVVLDFWAEWCGPCRNDLPNLSGLHKKRDANGLVVIGVHPPGSKLEAIEKVMKEFDLGYPQCIDVPRGEGPTAWGRFSQSLSVDRLPHAVLVDRQGKVVRTGELNDVLLEALKPEEEAK